LLPQLVCYRFVERGSSPGHEARRKNHIRAREGVGRPALRGHRNTRENSFSVPLLQGSLQFIPWQRLNLAAIRYVQFRADRACEIDVKAAQAATVVEKIERRKISCREKS